MSQDLLACERDDPQTEAPTMEAKHHENDAEHILRVARETVARVRYCWVATSGGDGAPNTRVVEPFSRPDEPDWTVTFLTSRRSRKASEIERSARVALGYQYDPELACVTLIGTARLIEDRAC